ncbi:polysaccharide lyase [Thalassospira mesophila]|uniref:polysaccharide lyase n=1 Tax=Thalassospira mesophila TaxID=1293891 RepID=UPI001B80E101|nr:polysaccharide lyase [Thalassospira mesophila]
MIAAGIIGSAVANNRGGGSAPDAVPMVAASPDAVARGNFGPFVRSLNDRPYGYQLVADPVLSHMGKGNSSTSLVTPLGLVERFEVRPGDCGGENALDCGRDRERSELSERGDRNPQGSSYWYGWSLYIPDDFANVAPTKVVLGQFHQEGSHPAWMFEIDPSGYHIDNHISGRKPGEHLLINEAALRARWHDITVYAHWTTGDEGVLQVWADNQLKFDYRGPTMSAGKVYFKYGLYRSFVSRYQNANETDKVPAQTVYFANVKRAGSRAGLAQ